MISRLGIFQWLVVRMSRALKNFERKAQALEISLLLTRAKSCGVGTYVHAPCAISGIENLELGTNVHIGRGAFIRAEGGLVIGDNTHISRNLLLYTVNHRYEGSRLPYDTELLLKPVIIGRNVWIGMNVCIAPGSVIGDGAIIGMGTVVSGVVPPLSIIAGQKWRVIGTRNEKRYHELETRKSFGGPDGMPLEQQSG